MSGFEPVLLPLLTPLGGALGKLAFIGLRKCYKKYSQYKEERKEQGTENAADPVESALRSTEQEIDQRYDRLAVLGPKFVRGDFQARRDLYDINRKGKVFDIQQKISELYTSSPGKDRPNTLHDMQSLQHSIKLAGEDIVGVLESWAFRLLSEKWPYQVLPRIHNSQELFSYIEKIPTSFPVERQALYYCDGAMALQQNRKSTLHEISMPQKRDLPLTWTCKFCFLEISDYRRAAMAWDMGAWNSLGMSHVVACVSYTDRRAAFKCIDCDDLELRKIYADPAVFIQHIKMHQDERRQARMDKSSINNREGALGRATSASAYETENSLDKSKPKFKDPDPEGKRLEREISRELGEEASDDSQAGETPEEFGNPKKVPLVASEPRTERGDGSSEADEEASSVASDEYQLRWGDPDSTAMSTRTLPTYTEAVGANPSRDAGQGGHRPGKAGVKATPLGSDVKTRPMAKKGIQQEYVDVEDAGGDTVHKSQRKQEASDSTVQRRSDLHEAYNTPFSSYSLYNEHAEKEMLHEMETHKSKVSPSATINRPQDNGEPAEAAKEQKVSNESLRAGNDIGGRELPEFAASRDLSTSKGTTPRAGVLPELPTAKGSNRKPTAPMAALTSGSIFDPTEVVMPAHNLGDPKSTSTVNQRTPDRNETGKGKDADLAEQIDFHKPATPRGGDGQGREQVFKTQDVPGGPISRPSRPAPDPPSTTGGMSQGRALYEYHARDPRQLSITAGDILKIVRKRDNDWWLCLNSRTHASGLVPRLYVQELPPTRLEQTWEHEQPQQQPQPQTQTQTQWQAQTQTPQSPVLQRAPPKPDDRKSGFLRKPIK